MMDISRLYITWNDDYKLFYAESMDYPDIKTEGETSQEAIKEFYIALEEKLKIMGKDAENNR